MPSEEHERVVKLACKEWNVKPVVVRKTSKKERYYDKDTGRIRYRYIDKSDKRPIYYPDGENNNIDLEVEMLNVKKSLLEKKKKWDSNKKKILIVHPSKEWFDNFDEVYFMPCNNVFVQIKE